MCHLALYIDVCQYRRVSNFLPVIETDERLACCAPLAGPPIDEERSVAVAALLKALADPVRLRLLSLVLSHEGGEACVCDLLPAFDLSQPTISHHLKVLHGAGILDREKRGTWVYYRARPEALASVRDLFGPAGG
jgi:ArsR family transcriptional regulator